MKIPRGLSPLVLACLFAGRALAADAPAAPVPLAGQWRFAMDPEDAGFTGEWFKKDLADKIQLPGILQAQGYGDDISTDTRWIMGLGGRAWLNNPQFEKFSRPGNVSVSFLSQPPKHYLGVAWYQRDIDIPASWAGKRVELLLERTRWQTTVWVDDRRYAFEDSLVAPHVTDLGILSPGKHRLTIRVDNRMMYNQRLDGHSVTDGVAATWNGILGKIELRATSPVWIQDAQVFPNLEKKSALIKVKIGNDTGQAGEGTLVAALPGAPSSTGDVASVPVKWDANGGTAEIELPFGSSMRPWDEFHPDLSTLSLSLQGGGADDLKPLTFGFREITTRDRDMFLNGKLLNVRMTHFGGDFALLGHPATDVETWKKIIQTCKDFGMNGMRFHSWCPPEAAFIAADELGFYLQPEGPFWDGFGVGSATSKRLDEETARMIAAYGNHPSFLFFSPSNESSGAYGPVWAKTNYEKDPRRLYATSTGIDASSQVEGGAQYAIMAHTQRTLGDQNGGQLRVSDANQIGFWYGSDYGKNLLGIHIPVLAHEVGQWCAYPDFDVIKEYTGYIQPRNFEIFRDSAAENGVLDRNHEFAWASGKFQLACYKAEIETNLRTPGLSGFQLLELHDNTEQGTALIGVLDPLWQPKSYVTGAEYRRFAGPTVPLARLQKRVFADTETLTVPVELSHFGDKPLANVTPYWKVLNLSGNVVAQGQWAARDIPIGKNIALGDIPLDFSKLPAPMEYKIVVGLTGTTAENDWNIWIYHAAPAATPADVLVTHSWPEAEARLAAGGKVLFTPRATDLGQNSPPLNNVPVFWNRQMNPGIQAMMGLWCDAKHPALGEFPTEAFCDWQWTDLVKGVRAVNIATAPAALKPIVSAVDDWNRNWKLGVIFEAKVGNGKLLVSAIDLDNNRTSPLAARQLRASLVDYMAGTNFNPPTALTLDEARSLWPGQAGEVAPAAPTEAPPPEIDTGSTRVIPRA